MKRDPEKAGWFRLTLAAIVLVSLTVLPDVRRQLDRLVTTQERYADHHR